MAARVAKDAAAKDLQERRCRADAGFRAPADHAKPRPTRTGTRHRWTSLMIPGLAILLWDAVYAQEMCTGRRALEGASFQPRWSATTLTRDESPRMSMAMSSTSRWYLCTPNPVKSRIADQGQNGTVDQIFRGTGDRLQGAVDLPVLIFRVSSSTSPGGVVTTLRASPQGSFDELLHLRNASMTTRRFGWP